jgi:glucokinase
VAEDHVIGVDVGGTKILAGVVDRGGEVGRTSSAPTPRDSQEALLDAIVAAVGEVRELRTAAVGFGVPSQIDQRLGTLGHAVNIPLAEISFRDLMTERLGLPVALDNDANVAAFAEWSRGAAQGTETMVMLTLGTGVGGGFVLNGRPYRGWAEVGHIVVEKDGVPCQGSCTGHGHLEAYASGHAADRIARERLGPGTTAYDLVAQGHPALAEIGSYLGAGIATLANLFHPEVVVIGGGFGVAAFDLLHPAAAETLRVEALAGARDVPIVRAELGQEAGVVGAALIAFDALS